ncbi:hypothetical protein GCM10011399_06370 [Subtercola lobariae]|uniref:Uncharacterized protein n=1 Tax=Subtercola lobariae TaxID=1588641 RepID=A0A917EUG4_9MICO|nr:hypothetical protein GCM10011399_06370 [Subtercola lobariae]
MSNAGSVTRNVATWHDLSLSPLAIARLSLLIHHKPEHNGCSAEARALTMTMTAQPGTPYD